MDNEYSQNLTSTHLHIHAAELWMFVSGTYQEFMDLAPGKGAAQSHPHTVYTLMDLECLDPASTKGDTQSHAQINATGA